MKEHDPAASQLCLPLSGDRGSAALRDIATSSKRRGRRSPGSSAAAPRCSHCRSPVKVPQWLLAQGLENYYCNAECRQAWASDITQPNRRTLTPGKETRARHRGANWGMQSKAARERDRYTCRVCGLTEEELGKRLHVHHTIPYSRFKSNIEANRLDYLVSVCPSCHGQLEAQLRRDLPLFADIDSSTPEHSADGGNPANGDDGDRGDDRRQILGGN